jgi:hypothetical protein
MGNYEKTKPGRLRAVFMKGYAWRDFETITIGFLEGTQEQKNYVKRIVQSTWVPLINLNLVFVNDSEAKQATVRIIFNESDGAWSDVGTQHKNVKPPEPTMNLGWLDDDRHGGVVKHEFGHMLGLAHEHRRPDVAFEWDKPKVYADMMGPPNNWSKDEIDKQVFHTLKADQLIGTAYDPKSIMHYIFDCNLFKKYPQNFRCSANSIQFLSDADKALVKAMYDPTLTKPRHEENRLQTVQDKISRFAELKQLRVARRRKFWGWVILSCIIVLVIGGSRWYYLTSRQSLKINYTQE